VSPITRLIAVLAVVLLSLSVADVAYASNWTVVVRAGSSAEAQAQALPAAPTAVTSACTTPASNKQITVAWSSVSNATDFEVWQSFNSGTYMSIGTLTGTAWTSGTGLAAGTYTYEVETLVGSNWASGQSSPTAARTIKNGAKGCQ
jgi:hypothetical protein